MAGASCAYASRLLTELPGKADGFPGFGTAGEDEGGPRSKMRWGMVVDLEKCRADCTACIEACRNENNVAYHGDSRWDIHWIRKATLKKKHGADAAANEGNEKHILLLCNHCDKPPCAQVCPVQATYKRQDGIVIVDHHRCIGCRYCVVACPYNARYFNFKESEKWPNKDFPKRSHGVAEACTLCAHLLERSEKPACVRVCEKTGVGALVVGDLNDPESEVSRIIASKPVKRIRADLGTEPKVYYVGL